MEWDFFNSMAIIAFAFSGAIVALQEKYDIFGVYVLGLAASFGGGYIRCVLMGLPVKPIWEQGSLLYIALAAITIIYMLPKNWLHSWNRWNDFFDAVGLSAFAIQGAIFALSFHLPLGAVILSSIVTGIGGGMLRDVLARRKPMILQQEIYAVWAILVGVVIGMGWVDTHNVVELYSLFIAVTILRMLSIVYKWHLRLRELPN